VAGVAVRDFDTGLEPLTVETAHHVATLIDRGHDHATGPRARIGVGIAKGLLIRPPDTSRSRAIGTLNRVLGARRRVFTGVEEPDDEDFSGVHRVHLG